MACDAPTVTANAVAFDVLSDIDAQVIQTYLLAVIAGGSLVPATLLASAKAFQKCSPRDLQIIQVYSLATVNGLTDPETILVSARSYQAVSEREEVIDQTYLLAVNNGGSMDPKTLLGLAKAFQAYSRDEHDIVQTYLLALVGAGSVDPNTVLASAKAFRKLSDAELAMERTWLLCQGISSNLIPPGTLYPCPSDTYNLAVLANTAYDITWGANDASVTLCGFNYPSTGAATTTTVWTDACLIMELIGNICGTAITAVVVKPSPGSKTPTPSGFTWVQNTAGTLCVATWDAPPPFCNATELWTSSDDVTYSLAATVAAPGVTSSVASPTGDTIKYAKVRWISPTSSPANGPFGTALKLYGMVADYAQRIIAAGSPALTQAVVNGFEVFWGTFTDAGINTKFTSGFLNVFNNDALSYFVPFVRGRGANAWTLEPSGAGFSLTAEGIKGDGITNYMNSQATIHNAGTDSDLVSITLYIATGNSNAEQDMAGSGAGGPNTGYGLSNFLDVEYYDSPFDAGNGRIATANVAWAGYVSGNRVANNDQRIFKANSGFPHAQIGATNATIPTFGDNDATWCLMVFNANGAVSGWSTRRYGYCAVHTGLTLAQSLIQYNAIAALWAVLGRTVV